MRVAQVAWAALCAFIVYESVGEWRTDGPNIWAPLLISIHDVVENVAVYVLFGVLGVLSLGNTQRRHWLRRAVKIGMIAVLFSAINETLQLYTIDRVASVTDIVSAGVGALGGAAIVGAWIDPA